MTHGFMHLLWWLIVGHALADFVLQSGAMAVGKSPHHVGAPGEPPWYYWLTSHALIHGRRGRHRDRIGGTWRGRVRPHWLIDIGKCEHYYGFNTDQSFHLVCKLIWIMIVLKG